MLTPLETAAAENILKLIAGASLRDAEDVSQLAQSYAAIQSTAGYRWEPKAPMCGEAPCCGDVNEDIIAQTPVETPAPVPARSRAKKEKQASPEPAAADPLAADPGANVEDAGKSYEDKQADIKAAYIDKLRILMTASEAEGNAFKSAVSAEMDKRGIKKLSDPGEDHADDWFSFIVNASPSVKATADIDI